jgi:prolyl 4-hydroxylase
VSILLDNDFSLESIREHMGERFPDGLEFWDPARPDHRAIAETRITRQTADPKLRKLDTDRAQIYVLDDFMSAAECDAMIDIIDRNLRPSTITLDGGDEYFRTSSTCDLSLLNDPTVAATDEKIASTLGIRVAYSEGIQAQRYDLGQEFKAHTDYFEPGTAEYLEHAARTGNRTWTFMVYLNEGMEGGATQFCKVFEELSPKKGQAVIWNNLFPDGAPNPDTLHHGMPVTRGHKIVITKWFRERGTGPMFYDA